MPVRVRRRRQRPLQMHAGDEGAICGQAVGAAARSQLLVLTRVLRPAPGATRRLVLRQDQRVVRAFEAEERSGGPDGLYRVSLVGLARGPYILEFLLATAKTTFPSAIRIDVH